MAQMEQIKNLITDNDGMIQTSQVTDAGISKTVLYQYVKDNQKCLSFLCGKKG